MLYGHNQKLLPSIQTDEFLPPISPWTSMAGMFLVGTVGTAMGVSSWVKYNVTVKAPATVRPVGDTRLVQPEMEGTVKSILVKENQLVKQGDAIARLDDEQLLIKKSQLQGSLEQGKLQLIQMYAQIKSLEVQILAEKRVIDRTVASAKADLERNQREYQERQITTTNELLVAQASFEKAQTDVQKAHADLEFAKVDRDRYKQLSEIGAIARREFEQKKLAVEQVKAILEGEQKAVDIAKARVKSAEAALNPSTAMIKIASERIAQETAKGESTIATLRREREALKQRQVEVQSQLNQSQKEIQQLDTQLKSSIVRATSDGTILKLNLRNPGQVVRPGEAIAEIVPQNAPLVIKTMVSAADIKKVEVGQKVQLRVDACPYPDYGTLNGVVSAISPDAMTPQANNTGSTTGTTPAVGYFEATVKPQARKFGQHQHQCSIQAGMDAKADIISKEETALQFLLRKARLITDL
ncbi:HlyD family efflux transporter periplasmic adaptor subunit [Brasilonema octagenarum]|uniref:Hemolysin D n=1 Tax=Brasilonema octagenarum UFV-OR1 TaxID=417115 RepID=A0ABX1MCF2_9CYAN|nr:HlyD family efflux transporter periplasmic adaptor subunit [Brasilonema octagenarum]NMF65176.1 hemolysin D [Brasilonema octagenarum UFV-OR1]